jgi:hypothetical protein
MFFPHNLLPVMFFPRMWGHSYFSQNVLPIMFFLRMCCQ